MENKCKYKENEICNHTLCLCASCYIYWEVKNEFRRSKRSIKLFNR